jgi:Tfp pilus assembly protein PilZ
MPADRRTTPRTRLAGVRVTYESATGERGQADAVDLNAEGIFLQTATPMLVGKRISLEIFIAGEPASWPALGRVVWVRSSAQGAEPPCGMGIKLIDVDEAVLAAMQKAVVAAPQVPERVNALAMASPNETSPSVFSPAQPSVARGAKGAPAREATVAGVGPGTVIGVGPPRVIGFPPKAVGPGPATVMGVGPPAAASAEPPADPTTDAPFAIDLVAKKRDSTKAPPLSHAEASLPGQAEAQSPSPTDTSSPGHPDAQPLDLAGAPRANRVEPPPPAPAALGVDDVDDRRAGLARDTAADESIAKAKRWRTADAAEDTSAEEPIALPKRRGAGWWLVLLVILAAAISVYAYWDRLPLAWREAVARAVGAFRHWLSPG